MMRPPQPAPARPGLMRTALAAVCLTLLAGCETPVPAPLPTPAPQPANTDLAGIWRSTLDDGTLTMRGDGSFTVEWPASGRASVQGAWSTMGGEVSFINSPDSATCAGVKGVYLYQVRGDSVAFSPMTDTCLTRLDALRVPWVRLPPPKK